MRTTRTLLILVLSNLLFTGCNALVPRTDVALKTIEEKFDDKGNRIAHIERSAEVSKGAFTSDTNISWSFDPKTGLFTGSWVSSNDPSEALKAQTAISQAWALQMGQGIQTLGALGAIFAPALAGKPPVPPSPPTSQPAPTQ